MSNIMGLFKTIILVQLFFSFAINVYVYSMPDGAKPYVGSFSELSDQVEYSDVTTQVQESLTTQTNIPILDIGSLVFYSGNILLDLLVNFAFAIPEMVTLLISGVARIFNIEGEYMLLVQGFTTSVIFAMYFVSLIQVVTGIRSGRIT